MRRNDRIFDKVVGAFKGGAVGLLLWGILALTIGLAAGLGLVVLILPFGNCIEPSNVKAGGKACPIRFQCAGCGFYRPDPSYIPAIEEHINSLAADREIASAMDAAAFVIANLDAQIAAFRTVLGTMRAALDRLEAEQRNQVERASAVLRKARAGAQLPLEDITRRKETP